MALGYPYYIIRSSLSKSWTNSSFLNTYIVRAFFFVAFLAFAVVVDGQAPGVCESNARLVLMWLISGSAKVNSFLNMAIEECTGQENCNKGSQPSPHQHQLPRLRHCSTIKWIRKKLHSVTMIPSMTCSFNKSHAGCQLEVDSRGIKQFLHKSVLIPIHLDNWGINHSWKGGRNDKLLRWEHLGQLILPRPCNLQCKLWNG